MANPFLMDEDLDGCDAAANPFLMQSEPEPSSDNPFMAGMYKFPFSFTGISHF